MVHRPPLIHDPVHPCVPNPLGNNNDGAITALAHSPMVVPNNAKGGGGAMPFFENMDTIANRMVRNPPPQNDGPTTTAAITPHDPAANPPPRTQTTRPIGGLIQRQQRHPTIPRQILLLLRNGIGRQQRGPIPLHPTIR